MMIMMVVVAIVVGASYFVLTEIKKMKKDILDIQEHLNTNNHANMGEMPTPYQNMEEHPPTQIENEQSHNMPNALEMDNTQPLEKIEEMAERTMITDEELEEQRILPQSVKHRMNNPGS